MKKLSHFQKGFISYRSLHMSCNFAEQNFYATPTELIMKPLMLAKDEPDCDHVSESNYDDRQHPLSLKSNSSAAVNEDMDSDNEVETKRLDCFYRIN